MTPEEHWNKFGPCAPQCVGECDGACAMLVPRIPRDLVTRRRTHLIYSVAMWVQVAILVIAVVVVLTWRTV